MTAERKLPHGVLVSGGFASIDPGFGGLNADRFNRGKRLFAGGNVPLFGPVVLSAFYTHEIDNAAPVPIGQRFDAIVTCNILSVWQQLRR